jgi:UDP:flavonoid glycosyltransferase YjiC (YdhE family)
MRILFTTTRGTGHFEPLLPFVQACRLAGDDVLVAAPGSVAPMVERAGLACWAVGEGTPEERGAVLAAVRGLPESEANLRVAAEVFVGIDARTALPDVCAAVEEWEPDLIVSESAERAGHVAAERYGLPSVTVGITLGMNELWLGAPLVEAIDHLRRGLGLPSERRAARILGGPYLSLAPALLDDLSGWPGAEVRRYRDARDGTVEAPAPAGWGNPDAPLVYVTFGTVAPGSGYFPDLYRGALEALEGVDARVLMTVGRAHDPEELGPLPANARVQNWVPHAELLPHCAAMVCHGGSGTVRQGLAAGVPLVVLPLFADQPENARLVHGLGAGIALQLHGSARATVDDALDCLDRLPGAVRAVLAGPAYHAVAGRVAAEAEALPPIDDVVPLLHGLARARRDFTSQASGF